MRWLYKLPLRLRSLFRRSQVEQELSQELRFHLDGLIEQHVATGMTAEEARRAALLELGGVEQIKEECRDTRRVPYLDHLVQDVHYGVRLLVKNLGSTSVVVLTLALGIGANTAIFTVVYGLLLQPLPYPDPDRLVVLETTFSTPGKPTQVLSSWSYPRFEALTRQTLPYEGLAAFSSQVLNLADADDPVRVNAELVSANYFSMLGVTPVRGRLFRPDENSLPNRDAVALVSEDLWKARWGGEAAVMGRTIHVNRMQFTVVGVLPGVFRGQSDVADIWIPIMMAPALSNNPKRLLQQGAFWHQVIGRLAPGVTLQQAQQATSAAEQGVESVVPPQGSRKLGIGVASLKESRIDPSIRKSLVVLFGAVAFVLLIACANVANLLLARAASRQGEMSLRLALGASRGRILRQLLTEGFLLSVTAGFGALVVGSLGLKVIEILQPVASSAGTFVGPVRIPVFRSIGFGLPVLLFNFALALLTSVLFSLTPALSTSKTSPITSMKEARGGRTRRPRILRAFTGRGMLVVAELSLALVLLTGAGLLLKSFVGLLTTDLGFAKENLLTVKIEPPRATAGGMNGAFFEQLLGRISALSGVQSAGLTNATPLTSSYDRTVMNVRSGSADAGSQLLVGVHVVSASLLQTLRLPLLNGRWLADTDGADTPIVAVINESAARKYWPGRSAVGDKIDLSIGQGASGVTADIVGVVGDVRYDRIETAITPDVYLSYKQTDYPSYFLVMRTGPDPLALTTTVRRAVASMDRDLPIFDVRTMDQRVGDVAWMTRFSAFLLSALAVLALILAAIGIYGVMSFIVARRTREIGVRMALGAQPIDVLGLMCRDAIQLMVTGVAIGLALSFSLSHVLTSMLYVVTPTDATTFVAVALTLTTSAALASYIPARRATRVNPIVALRHE